MKLQSALSALLLIRKCELKILTRAGVYGLLPKFRFYGSSSVPVVRMNEPTLGQSCTRDMLHSQENMFTFQQRKIGKIAVSVVDHSPSVLKPYLKLIRVDKPTGTWLLYWPGAWSIGLAAYPGCLPDLYMLFLFGSGAIIMRGAGCIINDMWDKDFDSKVERTRTRPIASGQITMTDATMFLAGILALGDIILLQLNWQCVLLGASSLGLIVSYPLTKRYFNWPQLFLGLIFNWGALLGWTAVHGTCNFAVCLPLYVASISWTLIYDTIYAHQDKKYDVKIGVKSSALVMGNNTKKYLFGFSASMTAGLLTAGLASDQTFPYYLAVGCALCRTLYLISTLKTNDPEDCWRKFVSNGHLGFLIMLGIIVGSLMKKE